MSDNVGFPLSPHQSDKVDVFGVSQSVAVKGRLQGAVDANTLVDALNRLVALHETLRTDVVYVEKVGLHLQSLQNSAEVAFHSVEPAELEGDNWRTLVAQNRENEHHPVSMYLASHSSDDHSIVLACRALTMDASSLSVLAKQLCDAVGGELPDEEDVIQYADYAQWQSELIQGDDEDADLNALNHWQKQHQYPASMAVLPFGSTGGGNKGRVACKLQSGLLDKLTSKAQSLGAALESLLALGWSALICRHGQLSELMMTVEFECRDEELENSIGLYGKNAPLLIFQNEGMALAGAMTSLNDSLNQAKGFIDSYSWSDNHQPMGFGYRGLTPVGSDELTFTPDDLLLPLGRERLKLECIHAGDELTVQLDYDDGQYGKTEVQLILAQLQALLEAMADAPNDARLGSLNMYSELDNQVLGKLSHELPQQDYQSVISRFVAQVNNNPDAVAVHCGEQRVSFGKLYRQASGVAAELKKQGVECGEKVGVHMANPVNAIVGLVAIGLVGAVYVPLDISYPQVRLTAMIEDAGVKLVLVEPGSDGIDFAVPSVDICACAEDDYFEPQAVSAGSPVYVIFTSGSTGRPKGVLVSHGNLDSSNQARINFYKVCSSTRFLLLSSFSFDSSIAGLYSTLSGGGTLCLIDGNNVSEFDAVATAINNMQVTHTLMVPSLYSVLLPNVDVSKLASLKSVTVAGERCPQALIETHKSIMPGCELVNEYGPTEGTVWATADRLHCTLHTRDRVTLGPAIENTRLYLLDADWQAVPVGVVGELYIAGHGVTQGYCARPGQTAERFMPDICGDGQRMYRTGDLARVLSDGRFDFIGRADHQVKLRGFRIEIGEIEDVMLRFDGINSVAVELHGEEAQLVCFYCADKEYAEPELEKHALDNLPGYMAPGAYVALSELPLTPNGKVDRKALQAWDLSKAEVPYEAPQSDTEKALVELWNDLIHDHQIGRAHDFFHIGGHSLLAMQLSSRVRDTFDVDVSVQLIFDHSVLSEQAAQIDALKTEQDEDMDLYEF